MIQIDKERMNEALEGDGWIAVHLSGNRTAPDSVWWFELVSPQNRGDVTAIRWIEQIERHQLQRHVDKHLKAKP